MSESNKEKQLISFYLRKDLIKELDEATKSMHMNRSQFVGWLLTEALPRVKIVADSMNNIFSDGKVIDK